MSSYALATSKGRSISCATRCAVQVRMPTSRATLRMPLRCPAVVGDQVPLINSRTPDDIPASMVDTMANVFLQACTLNQCCLGSELAFHHTIKRTLTLSCSYTKVMSMSYCIEWLSAKWRETSCHA